MRTQYDRERGSAGGQLQKISAGKFQRALSEILTTRHFIQP
jgi:hypothetical protein